jgi:hypothetical protein
MVGGIPRKLNSTQFGHRVDEFRLNLQSLVGAQGLRAAEAGYPAGCVAIATASAVLSGMGTTFGQRVKRFTAVRRYLQPADGQKPPNVDVMKTGCWQ